MGNLILEAEKTLGKIVDPGSNVIFNTALPYSSRISYDPANGEIIFLETGQYLVLWWVATEITQRGPIQFALKTLDGDTLLGNSSSKRGQTSGFGVINVGDGGTTLSLVNMTAYQVILCPRLQVTSRILTLKIPEEGMGGVKTYRANLNATNRTLMVPIKDLTLEIVYVDVNNLDAYLTPSRTMTVDIRRLGFFGGAGVGATDLQFNDYLLSNRTRIDDNFYSRSNEKWYAWIRQQDQNGLWSLHEVSVFSSKGGARTTVWVTLIEEHVDYDNPNNPVD